MGFLEKIFPKKKSSSGYNWNYFLNDINPVGADGFGNNVYASDVVQQAVYAIVKEMKKLDMVHIRKVDGDVIPVEDSIQRCLENPNPIMTPSDYIERITWQLLLNYNAFIYPLWEGNSLVGLYPLQPMYVDFLEDAKTGEVWVQFEFANGYKSSVKYSNVIHLRYRYSGANEFLGGGADGKPDYKPLLETLKINDTMTKGLAKALNIQTSVNGIVKIKTMLNKDEQMKEVKEFEEKLKSNSSGLLPLDISSEYIPVTKQVNFLDNNVLEFLDRKVLRYWGVSIPIINGDYTKEQYEAFYQTALEPIVKTFTEGHTKGVFSSKASFGFGNKIAFYPQDLIFLNTTQKLEMVRMLGDSGSIYENEKRTAFGLRPLPELTGVRMQSLNYVNVEDARKYQVGDNKSEGVNGNEE